jgi:alanine dehydrogenase
MIIGGGVVGINAAVIAIGMGAEVNVLDRTIDRLRDGRDPAQRPRVDGVLARRSRSSSCLPQVDLVIGAVLVHGARRRTSSPARSSGS